YPAERVRHMLTDSAPVAVLVHAATRHVPEAGLLIDLDQPSWASLPATNPVVAGLNARHLAYVIYTSGSTGLPKGVMNEHAGVVNRLLWMQDAYGLDAADVVLQKTPFSFDVSVWEFLWPLQTGARLVMARPGGHRDPEYLREVIAREHVTTLHFVPSMLDVFLSSTAPVAGAAAQPDRDARPLLPYGEAALDDQYSEPSQPSNTNEAPVGAASCRERAAQRPQDFQADIITARAA
ncbi:AMP-binding protein, partial [Pseudomonas juntendi]|nr:AMP-binding protein [Pseudomonas juntendi]